MGNKDKGTYVDNDGYRIVAFRWNDSDFGKIEDLASCAVYNPEGREVFHSASATIKDFSEEGLNAFLKEIRQFLDDLKSNGV